MLHLQLRVPSDLTDEVVDLLTRDPTVTNIAVVPGGFTKPAGSLVLADVARENTNSVISALRHLDLHHRGSIMVAEPGTLLSDEVAKAEHAAPGMPDDGVVWDIVEDKVRRESQLSFAFAAFLTLATLIAGAGRVLDQPILIIGAMVVGPEFSPIAAICVAIARPRPSILPRALFTLLGGFAIAVVIATPIWWAAHALGGFSREMVASGPLTDFIVRPDWWSFAIALLAGIAGVLSLTTAKSGPLVGVFISVTTVPAVGTLALSIGSGVWSEVTPALTQLSVNVAGMILSGSLTLLLQRVVWARVRARVPRNIGALHRF